MLKTMTYATAIQIWGDIQTTEAELKENLTRCAVRYARLRTDWRQAPGPAERLAMDASRTAAHNALIDACNILSRNMARHGESTTWRKRLGDDRKVIGDFTCHLHCLLGLEGSSSGTASARPTAPQSVRCGRVGR